jgi:hypothetical protein
MRVLSRITLVVISVAALSVPAAFGQPNVASCPVTLVAQNAPATDFYKSPHGVFRFGTQVFQLRGQTLTTYTVTDLGDMQVAREDFIGSMAARESNGGVAFNNGHLFVSSEAGIEIFDLRGVRVGGNAPLLVSRTPNVHYRRLAVFGNTLAALFPATDMPCYVNGSLTCFSVVDLYDISNLAQPRIAGSISSRGLFIASFNDIAFNFGMLITTGFHGTAAWEITNRANPMFFAGADAPGTFLVSNGTNLLGVGNERQILTYQIASPGTPGFFNFFTPITLHTPAPIGLGHANPIVFHPQASFDEQSNRIITMLDELDPQTLKPARTIAFDIFDYNVFMYEGSLPRVYEQISFLPTNDEVKYNPLAVGPLIYVVGELSGLQTYGACGQMSGKIEFPGVVGLGCSGAELHGWVTGALKITNVEIFFDSGSLGSASITGPPRTDVPSTTPVTPWRITVNLDQTARGVHTIRAVGTDANGNRRQFASQQVFFPGPGLNCTRRRATGLK